MLSSEIQSMNQLETISGQDQSCLTIYDEILIQKHQNSSKQSLELFYKNDTNEITIKKSNRKKKIQFQISKILDETQKKPCQLQQTEIYALDSQCFDKMQSKMCKQLECEYCCIVEDNSLNETKIAIDQQIQQIYSEYCCIVEDNNLKETKIAIDHQQTYQIYSKLEQELNINEYSANKKFIQTINLSENEIHKVQNQLKENSYELNEIQQSQKEFDIFNGFDVSTLGEFNFFVYKKKKKEEKQVLQEMDKLNQRRIVSDFIKSIRLEDDEEIIILVIEKGCVIDKIDFIKENKSQILLQIYLDTLICLLEINSFNYQYDFSNQSIIKIENKRKGIRFTLSFQGILQNNHEESNKNQTKLDKFGQIIIQQYKRFKNECQHNKSIVKLIHIVEMFIIENQNSNIRVKELLLISLISIDMQDLSKNYWVILRNEIEQIIKYYKQIEQKTNDSCEGLYYFYNLLYLLLQNNFNTEIPFDIVQNFTKITQLETVDFNQQLKQQFIQFFKEIKELQDDINQSVNQSQLDQGINKVMWKNEQFKNKLKKTIFSNFQEIGLQFNKIGNLKVGLYFLEQALQHFDEVDIESQLQLAQALNNIGDCYYQQGNIQLSIKYKERSLMVMQSMRYNIPLEQQIKLQSGLGESYEQQRQYQQALDYYSKSLKTKKMLSQCRLTYKYDIVVSYCQLSRAYYYLQKQEQSLKYLTKCQSLCGELIIIKDQQQQYENMLQYISQMLININNIPKSEQYLKLLLQHLNSQYEDQDFILTSLQDKKYHHYKENLNQTEQIEQRLESLKIIGVYSFKRQQYQYSIVIFQYCLNKYQLLYYNQNHPRISDILMNLGYVYKSCGFHSKALEYFLKAVKIRQEIFNNVNLDLAVILDNIGQCYEQIENIHQAITYYQRSERIFKKLNLTIQPENIILLNHIGVSLFKAGQLKKSQEYLLKAYELSQELVVDQQKLKAESAYNLGAYYLDSRDKKNALEKLQEALQLFQKVYASDHIMKARIYNKLGIYHKIYSNFEESMVFHKKALEIYEKILTQKLQNKENKENIQNLFSMNKLLHSVQNDISITKNLEINNRILKEENDEETFILKSEIALSYIYLSICLENQQNNLKSALKYKMKALEIRRELFQEDENNLIIALTLLNIGKSYLQLSELKNAIYYFQESLKIYQSKNDGQQSQIQVLFNLGECFRNLQDFKIALEYYLEAYKLQKKLNANYDQTAISTLRNIIQCYKYIENFKYQKIMALELKLVLKQIKKQLVYGGEVYQQLGYCYFIIGKKQKSLLYYDKAYKYFVQQNNLIIIAKILKKKGKCFLYQQEFKSALSNFEQSFTIYKRLLTENNRETIMVKCSMAVCYQHLGDLLTSLQLFEESNSMINQIYYGNHPDISRVMCDYGACLTKYKRYDKAIQLLEQSLKIRLALQPKSNLKIAFSLDQIGLYYFDNGNIQIAIKNFQESLQLKEQLFQEDINIELAKSYRWIADCFKFLNQNDQSKLYYQKSLEIYQILYSSTNVNVQQIQQEIQKQEGQIQD